MTPEQAEIIEFADKVCPNPLEGHRAGLGHFFPCPTCQILEGRIRAAVEVERERCVRAAEWVLKRWPYWKDRELFAAIRIEESAGLQPADREG